MPEIPQYKSKEKISSLRQPRATPYDFGFYTGQAIAEAGGTLVEISEGLRERAAQLQERRDMLDAVNASNGFRDEVRAKDQELRSVKGRNARNLVSQFTQYYDNRRNEIAEKLSDGARERFLSLPRITGTASWTAWQRMCSPRNRSTRTAWREASIRKP